MSGFSVRVRIDDSSMRRRISRFARATGDMTPALKAFGVYMEGRTEERFSGEHDPEGKRWQDWSKATKKSDPTTSHGRRKILTKSHRLRRSVTAHPGRTSVVLGTNAIYGRIHQLGGRAGRGHRVIIPARPYAGFNADDVAEFIATLKDHLELSR